MLIFLIVVLVLSAVLEGLSLRAGTEGIGLDLHLSDTRIEPGQSVTLTTRVENGGMLPITYLSLRTEFPLCAMLPETVTVLESRTGLVSDDVYRMWWRQRITRSVPIAFEKRGVHTVNAVNLQRGDFLGLNTTNQPLSLWRTVLVYPKPLESAALIDALGDYCGELIAQRWLIRDPILTLGVREYTGNEPMHTISWTQTARRGELTVREFDYTRSLHCCVVFCVNGVASEETALLDACCSAVRTVCETLTANGVEPEVYTNAVLAGYTEYLVRKYSAADGRMQDVLEALARVTAAAVCTADALVSECLHSQEGQTAYLLVTPRRDSQAENALAALERSGAAATLVAVEELGVTVP